jgi:negative regulator of flagellin synthesis FlgM
MRINGSGPSSPEKTRESGKTGGAGPSREQGRSRQIEDGGDSAEKVAISSKARDIAKAREAAGNAPDVDEAKVARLRSAIKDGSYKVDADKVADRLVDEHLHTMF